MRQEAEQRLVHPGQQAKSHLPSKLRREQRTLCIHYKTYGFSGSIHMNEKTLQWTHGDETWVNPYDLIAEHMVNPHEITDQYRMPTLLDWRSRPCHRLMNPLHFIWIDILNPYEKPLGVCTH